MGIGQIVVVETPDDQVESVKESLKTAAKDAFAFEVFETQNKLPELLQRLSNKTRSSEVSGDSLMMTVILKPVSKIKTEQIITEQKLYASFPPPGTKIIYWYSVQGIGDIVSLEFPASQLRAVNLSLEHFGWKAYYTSFYPSYDFYGPARDTFHLKNTKRKSY